MISLVQLTDEQRMLTEAVGKIGAKYGHTYFAEKGRCGERPSELWRELGQAGFLGVGLPKTHGAGGILELGLVLEELAANGLPSFMGVVSPGIYGSVLTAHGSEELRDSWLPAIASGTGIMAFAITEANAGSNIHRLTTNAGREGQGWVLNGSKQFISCVDQADAVLVVARTGSDPAIGRGLLSIFIIPTDTAGLVCTAPVSRDMVINCRSALARPCAVLLTTESGVTV